eukprot:356011-Chlamydomonas_euryale.AAC.4
MRSRSCTEVQQLHGTCRGTGGSLCTHRESSESRDPNLLPGKLWTPVISPFQKRQGGYGYPGGGYAGELRAVSGGLVLSRSRAAVCQPRRCAQRGAP